MRHYVGKFRPTHYYTWLRFVSFIYRNAVSVPEYIANRATTIGPEIKVSPPADTSDLHQSPPKSTPCQPPETSHLPPHPTEEHFAFCALHSPVAGFVVSGNSHSLCLLCSLSILHWFRGTASQRHPRGPIRPANRSAQFRLCHRFKTCDRFSLCLRSFRSIAEVIFTTENRLHLRRNSSRPSPRLILSIHSITGRAFSTLHLFHLGLRLTSPVIAMSNTPPGITSGIFFIIWKLTISLQKCRTCLQSRFGSSPRSLIAS
jgi:hypothetical protein